MAEGSWGSVVSPGKGYRSQAGTERRFGISHSRLCPARGHFSAGSGPPNPILQQPPVTADGLGGEDPGALGVHHSLVSTCPGDRRPQDTTKPRTPSRALRAPRKQALPHCRSLSTRLRCVLLLGNRLPFHRHLLIPVRQTRTFIPSTPIRICYGIIPWVLLITH